MTAFLIGIYAMGFIQHFRYEKPTTIMNWALTVLWFAPLIEWAVKKIKAAIALVCLPSLAMAAGSPEISLGEAFAYCFSQPSYVWTVVIGTLLGITCILFAIRLQSKEDFTMKHIGIIAVGVIMIFACWLARPTYVKANTTPEQASRGVYIG